ncbi:MAG: nitroreductase family protein [Lactobacillales bacterium]|nr:nitroreductase family protein [Lactobacillales bacterium]
MELLQAIQHRRSYYGISKESSLPDSEIEKIVKEAVKHTPSAFNMQSARAVVLLGAQHDLFWKKTTEILKKIVPADKFSSTQSKMDSFGAGYGTVLFFEDTAVVDAIGNKFKMYKDNFPIFATQESGMMQQNVWMILEANGFGASLQHYNPLVDEMVAKTWDIPASWKLIAEMPFGKPTEMPGAKEFMPIAEKVKVYK